MSETEFMKAVRTQLSDDGILNFRNNVGKLQDITGRWVTFGLCIGSSDIIGIRPIIVTGDMVGRTIGQFVAVEVKSKGEKPTAAQMLFLQRVNMCGGLGYVKEEGE